MKKKGFTFYIITLLIITFNITRITCRFLKYTDIFKKMIVLIIEFITWKIKKMYMQTRNIYVNIYTHTYIKKN